VAGGTEGVTAGDGRSRLEEDCDDARLALSVRFRDRTKNAADGWREDTNEQAIPAFVQVPHAHPGLLGVHLCLRRLHSRH
jgi:hypothetical protein